MSWFPTTDFENEVVSMQPDQDFIYGRLVDSESDVFYPRPDSHLLYAQERKRKEKETKLHFSPSMNRKLKIISKVQQIAGTKPLGEQPTISDWDDEENVERETIAMMRHLGINSSVEGPLDEQRTIATLPIDEDMLIMHNGRKRMPIFYHDKFFKLKPRVSNSSSEMESAESMESAEMAPMHDQSSASQSTADEREVVESESRLDNTKLSNTKNSSNFETTNENSCEVEGGLGTQPKQKKICNTARDYISSRSWYRSDDSSSSTSSGDRRQQERNTKSPRFYTARELYNKHAKK